MKTPILLLCASVLSLSACETAGTYGDAKSEKMSVKMEANSAILAGIIDAQDEKAKARYQYRNPQETIEFFGLEPGDTIVEALPGGGWYSKILIPYIGDEGALVGVDYSLEMWPEFGGFANAEFLEKKKTWPATWTEGAQEWRAGSNADIKAFTFQDRDTSMDGTVDKVLFIRALHNLARFEDEGAYLTKALADTHALLKPGGIVGVVQHRAPAGNKDEWADGNNGYLKQDAVIAFMDKAGFDLVDSSEINANPLDKPTNKDLVWRLPPTFATSSENAELKAKLTAVGESDRMTLKFKKR